ncbi:hypothetical protein WISP_135366 [Willisornis vidua]|uniref:Uncharacterized protein n=1 Tax=Willisornis vidua TaxID=1566151 RepID=A0ABQ9CNH4_9PASS|nr:hypothetical protein WISP_135366 [Willisornis vidua]
MTEESVGLAASSNFCLLPGNTNRPSDSSMDQDGATSQAPGDPQRDRDWGHRKLGILNRAFPLHRVSVLISGVICMKTLSEILALLYAGVNPEQLHQMQRLYLIMATRDPKSCCRYDKRTYKSQSFHDLDKVDK